MIKEHQACGSVLAKPKFTHEIVVRNSFTYKTFASESLESFLGKQASPKILFHFFRGKGSLQTVGVFCIASN